MRILCNGIPKSGTHALLKGLELLGYPRGPVVTWQHTFFPFTEQRWWDKHVFIYRHPRNCLVSYIRWRQRPVTTGHLIGAIYDYLYAMPFADAIRTMQGWLSDPDTHCLRYEDFVANDAALRGVAAYLGSPYYEDAFEHLPGLTETWTGAPSDWNSVWNEQVQAVWVAEGLQELQVQLGYNDA